MTPPTQQLFPQGAATCQPALPARYLLAGFTVMLWAPATAAAATEAEVPAPPATAASLAAPEPLIDPGAPLQGESAMDLFVPEVSIPAGPEPLAPSGPGGEAAGPGGVFRQALTAYHEGNPAAAETALSAYLADGEAKQWRGEAHFLSGLLALQAGNPEVAAQRFVLAVPALTVLRDYAAYYHAEALFAAGRTNEAAAAYGAFVKEHTPSRFGYRARWRLADMLYAQNLAAEALAAYTALLKDFPGTELAAMTRYNAAVLLFETGERKEAVRRLWNLYLNEPTEIAAALAYRKLYEWKKRKVPLGTPPAAQKFARAQKLKRAYWVRSALTETVHLLSTLKPKGKDAALYMEARLFAAQIRFDWRWGDHGRGDFEYVRDHAGKPAHKAQALAGLAHLLLRSNRNEAAAEAFAAIAAEFADTEGGGEALYFNAWILLRDGQHDAARALFERFVRAYPKHPRTGEGLWQVGWAAYRAGRAKTARKWFARLAQTHAGDQLGHQGAYWAARATGVIAKDDRAAKAEYETVAGAWPVSYYTFMAQQRLAAMGAPPPVTAGMRQPTPLVPSIPEDPLPDLDGDHHLRTAQHLLRLGFKADAAAELKLGAVAPNARTPVLLAIAQAYARAEDYFGAMRSVQKRFPEALQRAITPGTAALWRASYPMPYPRHVGRFAEVHGVEAALVAAIMREESTFRPTIRSPAGAIGLMQVMPYTGEAIAKRLEDAAFTANDLNRPEVNIRYGTWYLRQLIDRFHGNLAFAVASYNGGPGAVTRWAKRLDGRPLDEWVEEIGFKETRNYVKRVLKSYGIYRRLYAGAAGFTLPEAVRADYVETVNF